MATPMRFVRLSVTKTPGVNRTVGYRVIADYDEEVTGQRVIVLERPETLPIKKVIRKPKAKLQTPQTVTEGQQEASHATDR